MFSLLFSLLFSFAALSPFLEKAWTAPLPHLTTVCTEWDDLSLYLPETLIAAPLSNEDPQEQTFVSTDGRIEVIVRRRARTQVTHAAYNAQVNNRWAHADGTVDLLDKEVADDQYRLEWLVDRSVLVETAFALGDEWISVEASGPLAQRALLKQVVDTWRVERILSLP